MKINIKTTNIALHDELTNFIEKKLGSLARFIKRFERLGELLLDVELGRFDKHHRHGKTFYAEATLAVPYQKYPLRAEQYDKDLFVALTEVKDKLQVEIKRYKEIRITKSREGFIPPVRKK